ncbi:MAG: tRNA-guanine transglycosylase, partial [Vampirovibrio sp.]|nr:tRNA-guanine transglycosylase [Vampirovibrio sp.]
FDECPPYPASYEYAKQSLDKTHRWLAQCFEHHARTDDQALFPIVQGSTYEDLRTQSVEFATQMPAHGFAIGGVSVGESKEYVDQVVAFTAPQLPQDKPRYLMGVGTPEDLLEHIKWGIDMFDCVMPTRIARHGSFFAPTGRKIIKNAEFTEDFGPLVDGCECYACQHHTAAYIRHLFRQGEFTAGTLLSIHNIYTLIQLAQNARQAILENRFDDFYAETLTCLGKTPGSVTV